MARKISLTYKVIFAFLLVLLPILLAFLVSFENNKKHIQKVVIDNLRDIVEVREGDIYMFLEMKKNRVQDFSTDGFVTEEAQALSTGRSKDPTVLNDYLRERKLSLDRNFYRLSMISREGRVLSSTAPEVVGKDMSAEEHFNKGLSGPAITERDVGYKGAPELAFSAPVYSRKTGEQIGVLSGFIRLSDFSQVFTGEYSKELGAISWDITRNRKTLEIYLVNREKLMLSRSRFIENTVLKQKVDTEPVNACLSENRETTGFYPDYRGVKVAGASMCYPTMGWTLLAEMDESEILEPVNEVRKYALFTFIIVAIFVSALVLYFLKTVVGQLKKLAGAAGAVARGEYDITLPVKTSDELGALAECFNEMTLGIRERNRAITESEERLRSVLDNTINVAYIKDLQGRHTFVNKMFVEFSGLPMESIIGKTNEELFPPEVASRLNENDRVATDCGLPVQFEEEVQDRDGVRHTFLSSKFLLCDLSGNPYALCGLSIDITDRKLAEQALRTSEAGLSNAQRIAHIGSWDWDIVKNDLRWSDEIYRIFGVSPREFDETYDAFLSFVHPDDRAFVQNSVDDALGGGHKYSIDHRLIRRDGTERIVHEEAELVRDESGRPVRMFGTIQDVTERKRAEDEVRRLNEELEQKVRDRTVQLESANRELEAFSYTVAHDLKAPLRIIDGFSNILTREYGESLDEAGRGHLKRIRGASIRMSQLIDDLLSLSQVMRTEMVPEAVNLSAMARTIAEELRRTQPERFVDFMIQEGLVAKGDRRLLRIALENLMGNAWKYTGKVAMARIEVGSSGKKDGSTVFFVKDNGAGFDMKYAERLFEVFQRLHSQDEFPGTGVGLTTVYRILNRHHGRIWARSEPGKGATFYFSLPDNK